MGEWIQDKVYQWQRLQASFWGWAFGGSKIWDDCLSHKADGRKIPF